MAPPDRVLAAINAAKLTSEGTKYAPALKVASQIIGASTLPRREVVIISDFQKTGWTTHNEIAFPRGTTVTPVDVGGASPDVGVSQVSLDRDSTGERDRITVAARLVNTSSEPRAVTATLAVGGRDAQTQKVTIPATGTQQVAFPAVVVPNTATKAAVRVNADEMTADDQYDFTIAPDASVSVLVVEPRGSTRRENQSLFMSRALSIGDRPAFRVNETTIDALTPRDLDGRALIVLDEVGPPAGAVGARLRAVLDAGAGVLAIPGTAGTDAWPADWRTILPAKVGQVVDRTADAGGTLSSVDYGHPVFELFNAPRSGDFSTARFYRYRALTAQQGSSVSARFDDGSPALVERPMGSGKLVLWASTLDAYWTNLPLQPVFLPFMHQLGKHVGRYADPRTSFTAGEVLDLSRHGELTAPFLRGRAADSLTELVLAAPSGAKERVTATGPNHLIALREQGFYELRGQDTPAGSGRPLAVNLDPSETDLAHVDPLDIVAAVTSGDAQRQLGSDFNAGTPQDQERRQKLWWYLLLGALLLMAVETTISNRLSRATS